MTRRSIAVSTLSLAVALLGHPIALRAGERGHHASTQALNDDPTAAGTPQRGTTFVTSFDHGLLPPAVTLENVALNASALSVGTSSSLPSLTPDVAIVPFAGDVFTTAQNGSLIAVDPRSTLPSAPLFSLEGTPLNLTWGQFSSATARSVALTGMHRGIEYTAVGIEMSGLIPNGVYSLFYRTFNPDSANPICPAVEPTVALTAAFPQFQKPDEESFVASSSGKAFFLASVAGRLLDAAQFQIWVIYHFDGQVYGPVANLSESQNCSSIYGIDAMRQLIIIQK